jgi:alginate O-acetyltransferase complex protein AlgI
VLSHALTLLFVCLAWTLFRAPDFHSALNLYAGQFGLQGFALGEELSAILRPVHGFAGLLGVLVIVAPLLRPYAEKHRVGLALCTAALWPIAGFMLSFALTASRETVPFLYFQF